MKLAHSFASELATLGTKINVTPFDNPALQHLNLELLDELSIKRDLFTEPALFESLFTVNGCLNKYAMAQKYGGHQFGQWNPELGDGRGLLLGEVIDKKGASWDLHLKGAGKTPYSRAGDGRAVLRSTIREYLAGEALHQLGIPSSRALCLITGDEIVYREKPEQGAMLIRTAPSHIRFGHFEYFYHSKQLDRLDALFKYSFKYHFKDCAISENPHLAMLQKVVIDTAKLIAKWQAFGFAHGVMNTDNMSIHGITFDFGPYAFLDDFDNHYICNHSDYSGRYAFDRQPGIALWNLNALAHGFSPYLSVEQLTEALALYEPTLLEHYEALMMEKLGLEKQSEDNEQLISDLLNIMESEHRDYTVTFRLLCNVTSSGINTEFRDHFISKEKIDLWLKAYQQRLRAEDKTEQNRHSHMERVNPKYILRNYLLQQAIEDAEKGDFDELRQLFTVIQSPFSEQPENNHYASPPPDWGKGMEISCSS